MAHMISLRAAPAWLLLLASLSFPMLLAGCSHEGGGKEDAKTPESSATPVGPHGGSLVRLSEEAIRSAKIGIGNAGPGVVAVRIETPGEVKLNASTSADVRPPYPGVVRRMAKELGARVSAGEVLAIIHSSESLTDYTVRSPIAGIVVARQGTVGAAVDHDSPLYTVANPSTVWVDFAIYPQMMSRIRLGQLVEIRASGDNPLAASGTLNYVGPALDQETRATYGRVVLPNSQGRWMPGLFVTAAVTVETAHVPVAVPEEAIVRNGTGSAVFLTGPEGFELRPVVVGRTDGHTTEIVQGLTAGDPIVIRNAFILQAELGKAEGGDED